jgi:hypothetical protein
VRSLIRLGLLDQYRLWVLFAAAGRGAALFAELASPLKPRLAKSMAFLSETLEIVYSPAPIPSRSVLARWLGG